TICVCLAKDPLRRIFAFEPGEKIHIHVSFEEGRIPEYYRLQILDNRRNSRLNRYGKGSSDIFVNNWPIPTTIRQEHLGVWQVWVNDRADEKLAFGQFFFVEHVHRSESPLLEGLRVLQLPERVIEIPVTDQEPISILQEEFVEEIFASGDDERVPSEIGVSGVSIEDEPALVSKIPVTAVKGIGKTYSDRLAKISIYSISEFWYYTDREHLAEIMRVTDSRLIHMLQDAEIMLIQEAEKKTVIYPGEELAEITTDDLLSIHGIGQTSVDRLAKIGIRSKSDLLDYKDLETLRKTLRMSQTRLEKTLASIGRIIVPAKVTVTKPIDPLIQSVTNVKGIGIKTAEKLSMNGIITIQDLINSDYSKLRGIPKTSYLRWKKNAATQIGQPLDEKLPIVQKKVKLSELSSIQGIGVKTAEKLNRAGISTIIELSNHPDLNELAKKTKLSKKRLVTWQSWAKQMR
ncbi:MAG: helix-hairpin-helix domain-containing protein, partial [Candidatus Hodarchaeota archaeon]